MFPLMNLSVAKKNVIETIVKLKVKIGHVFVCPGSIFVMD